MRLTAARVSSLRHAAGAAALLLLPIATPSSAVTTPSLAGTTVITASRPVVGDVRVPRNATVDTPFRRTPDITATGTGRLATFVLRKLDGADRDLTFVGGAAPRGAAFFMPVPEYPTPGGTSFDAHTKSFRDVTTVPAGRYRLYVVPDGERARITLRLAGLRGTATIAPATPAAAEVLSPPHLPVETPTPAGTLATYVERTLRRPGLALSILHGRTEASAAWEIVMCYERAHEAGDPLRATPGCPTTQGTHHVADRRFPETATDRQFVQAFNALPPGGHAVSTVFATQGVVTALDHAVLWLTY